MSAADDTPLWHTVRGGITHETDESGRDITVFSLTGKNLDGITVGQQVKIQTARLEKFPNAFKRTLDFMARDLERFDLV